MNKRTPDKVVSEQLAKTSLFVPQQVPAPAVVADVTSVPLASPPLVLPEIRQVYLPTRKGAAEIMQDIESQEGGPVDTQERILLYRPMVLGMGRVHFLDRRLKVDHEEDFALLAQPSGPTGVPHWGQARMVDLKDDDLMNRPEPDASFEQIPLSINEAKEFDIMKRELIDHLCRNSQLKLLYSSVVKEYSMPNESERDFRTRLSLSARERRDEEVTKLNDRYENRLRTLRERLRVGEAGLARKQAESQAREREVMVSVGESVLGMFLGRRSTRAASTALSKYRQRTSAKMSVQEAEARVEAMKKEIAQLEQELKAETDTIAARWDESLKDFEEVPVKPNRNDVDVDLLALAWAPHWQISYRDRPGSTRMEILSAY